MKDKIKQNILNNVVIITTHGTYPINPTSRSKLINIIRIWYELTGTLCMTCREHSV